MVGKEWKPESQRASQPERQPASVVRMGRWVVVKYSGVGGDGDGVWGLTVVVVNVCLCRYERGISA